jgi:hypothetical protein
MLARDRKQRFAHGDEIASALAPLVEAHGGSPACVAEFLTQMRAQKAPTPAELEEIDEATSIEVILAPHHDEPDADPEPPPAQAPTPTPFATPLPPVRAARHPPSWLAGAALLVLAGAAVAVSTRHSHHDVALPPALVTHAAPAPLPPPPADPTPHPSPPRAARLSVDLDSSARSYLDGVLFGHGARRARVTIDRPGEHVLRVTAPRRVPYVRTILVEPGVDLDFHISLAHPASDFKRSKVRTADGDYLVDPFPNR